MRWWFASMCSLALFAACGPQDECIEALSDDAGIQGADQDAGLDAGQAGQAGQAGSGQDAGQDGIDEPIVPACTPLGDYRCSPIDGFDCCFTQGTAYTYDLTRGCKTSLGPQTLCLKSVHPEGEGCYGEGAETCYFRDDGDTWFVVMAAYGIIEATDATMQRCPFEFSGELDAAGDCGWIGY